MRKIAREAVIFMLLGSVLGVIGLFGYQHHNEAASIKAQQEAIKTDCLARDSSKPILDVDEFMAQRHQPIQQGTVPVPPASTTGAQKVPSPSAANPAHPRQEGQFGPEDIEPFDEFMARRHHPDQEGSEPQLDIVQHPTLGTLKFPKDMNYDKRNELIENLEQQQAECNRLKNLRVDNLGLLLTATLGGFLYGFPIGLGVWILYRLIRFAVQG